MLIIFNVNCIFLKKILKWFLLPVRCNIFKSGESLNREKIRTFIVKEDDNNRRIDRIIRKMLPDTGLSQIYTYLRKGYIRINDKKIKQNYKAKINDRISIIDTIAEDLREIEQLNKKIILKKPALNIIFENNDILAVNKPAGLKAHGKSSINDMVLEYLSTRIKSSLSFKPGPAHRLDTNTTGIICFSKSLIGAQYLSYCFKHNYFNKYYLALIDGKISEKKVWKDWILKKNNISIIENNNNINAITAVYPVKANNAYSLIICRIDTGKYHQIRCQASYHNHPLSGDKKYKGSNFINSYILHSAKLSVKEIFKEDTNLKHKFKAIEAPLPEKARNTIKSIFGKRALNLAWEMIDSI